MITFEDYKKNLEGAGYKVQRENNWYTVSGNGEYISGYQPEIREWVETYHPELLPK